MVTIRIGNETRKLADAHESWITQQINRRRRDGQDVCVEVSINMSGVNVRLATPACGGAGGGSRRANDNELRIFELWNERGLNASDFTAGNLIAFLTQLDRMVG